MTFWQLTQKKEFLAALAILVTALGVGPGAEATVISTTTHGSEATTLDGQIASGDLLSGLIATELPGDQGWHPANTDPLDQLPAFTDDAGIRPSGLTGLLNDFPGAGSPTKVIQYDLGGLKNVAEIQILSGNNSKDGRVFSTTFIGASSDGIAFDPLGYFESDPLGTVNAGQWGSTLVEISDDVSVNLLTDVRYLRFNLYAVDNTAGQYRDPFDGVNPFTGVDDGLSYSFVSPLIFEIDAIEGQSTNVPEPGSFTLVAIGLAGLGWMCRSRRR